MAPKAIAGTEGYAQEAPALVNMYETISFSELHRAFLPLLPATPADIVDIGAGTGRDAAAFAAMGHRVVAVEPTVEFRTAAKTLHPSANIEWLDDHLPGLDRLIERGETFDLAMLTAVWMHLDLVERHLAMSRVARLVRERGLMMISFRHGPVPVGRRMFEVGDEETIELAKAEGFVAELVLRDQDSQLKRPGVSWSRIAFRRNGAKAVE